MKLVDKIRTNKKMIGLELYSGSPHNVEILGDAGFDFTMLDTEHTEYDTGHIANLIRAANSFGLSPVVRVETLNEVLIMKTLDRGTQGVIVPRISTAEQAGRAAAAAAFPPFGVRGAYRRSRDPLPQRGVGRLRQTSVRSRRRHSPD